VKLIAFNFRVAEESSKKEEAGGKLNKTHVENSA
jgi:hypothetical protein